MSAHGIFYKKLRSKTFFYYAFCAVCVGLVAINIISSQKYNKTMYGVMEGESESAIVYLRHIWGAPLFDQEMEVYQAEGRSDVLDGWAKVQDDNKKRIQNLESALSLYPYSPELYYNLSLLYRENGNITQATQNLEKAQEIDPALK